MRASNIEEYGSIGMDVKDGAFIGIRSVFAIKLILYPSFAERPPVSRSQNDKPKFSSLPSSVPCAPERSEKRLITSGSLLLLSRRLIHSLPQVHPD